MLSRTIYLRYAQVYQDKPSTVLIEVGFSSPREFEKKREKYFTFPPKVYEVELEHVLQAPEEEGLTSIIKRIAKRMKELSGVGHGATDLFWIHDDGTMPDYPRTIQYLTIGGWPMRDETPTESQQRADRETLEENRKVFEAFGELVQELRSN